MRTDFNKSSMNNSWQEKDIETMLGNVLRFGVILASAVILIGGIMYLTHHNSNTPNYTTFHGLQQPFHSLSAIIDGLKILQGEAIIQFGVLLLIATPIARIVFSIVGFLREKDMLYVFISLIVLAIIFASATLGIRG